MNIRPFPTKDEHGNDDVNSFGNFDFSKMSFEQYKQENVKLQERIDRGHYKIKTSSDESGITTVRRETGAVELYISDEAFSSFGAAPEAKSPPLNVNRSVSKASGHDEATSDMQPTVTKVTSEVGKVVNVPPELQNMAREHEARMQRAVIEGRIISGLQRTAN